eukprot:364840-Chlamydomonas_euryale.AAC.9
MSGANMSGGQLTRGAHKSCEQPRRCGTAVECKPPSEFRSAFEPTVRLTAAASAAPLAVFVAWHVLNPAAPPEARSAFLDTRFLTMAAVLGAACTAGRSPTALRTRASGREARPQMHRCPPFLHSCPCPSTQAHRSPPVRARASGREARPQMHRCPPFLPAQVAILLRSEQVPPLLLHACASGRKARPPTHARPSIRFCCTRVSCSRTCHGNIAHGAKGAMSMASHMWHASSMASRTPSMASHNEYNAYGATPWSKSQPDGPPDAVEGPLQTPDLTYEQFPRIPSPH